MRWRLFFLPQCYVCVLTRSHVQDSMSRIYRVRTTLERTVVSNRKHVNVTDRYAEDWE